MAMAARMRAFLNTLSIIATIASSVFIAGYIFGRWLLNDAITFVSRRAQAIGV